MKTTARPIRTTIVFGLICGLAFIPLAVGLSYVMPSSKAFCFTLWVYLAAYGFVLTSWSDKDRVSIVFPLLLALLTIFLVDSISAFLLIAVGVFSWIRSGICYPQQFARRIFAETALCLGSAALMVSFTPISMYSWAAVVWMFFLVQALYFVIFEINPGVKEKFECDTFDQAKEQAEKILCTGL